MLKMRYCRIHTNDNSDTTTTPTTTPATRISLKAPRTCTENNTTRVYASLRRVLLDAINGKDISDNYDSIPKRMQPR